ncbi:hypothetical protein C8Q79DRAFT_1004954 [Trametes meyenii]|nr:hypothetical protein C8Q79DRAFT_1004954 [Trametes meyenii]
MSTCSVLRREVAKFVLKEEVGLTSTSKLTSFCLFMSVDDYDRARHLRKLALRARFVEDADQQAASALAPILSRATNLAVLKIQDSEDLLSTQPGLSHCLTQLESLQHLRMSGAEVHVCNLLRRMRAPLKRLELTYDRRRDNMFSNFWDSFSSEEAQSYHPVRLCAGFAATLERLHMTSWNEQNTLLESEVVYPRLKRLHLEAGLPLSRTLVKSFPALSHLSVSPLYTPQWLMLDSAARRGMMFTHRERNLEDQRIYGSWPSLERCEVTGVLPLFLMGLTCHIEYLSFSQIGHWHMELLGPVMEQAKAVSLKIDLNCADFDAQTNGQASGVLRQHGTSLSMLDITVNMDDRDVDVRVVAETLRDSISHLPLEDLRLDLKPNMFLSPMTLMHLDQLHGGDNPPTSLPPLTLAEATLRHLDPKAYAERVAKHIPTLKSAIITVGATRGSPTRIACLTREDGLVTVSESQELSAPEPENWVSVGSGQVTMNLAL